MRYHRGADWRMNSPWSAAAAYGDGAVHRANELKCERPAAWLTPPRGGG